MAGGRWTAVVIFAVTSAAAGCGGGGPNRGATRRPTRVALSGGDVSNAAAPAASARWLTDGNVLALVDTIAAQEMDAAKLELQAWHSDTVRALAGEALTQAAALQHSADSLAAVLRVAPVAPALAASLSARLQAERAPLLGLGGTALDRAFVTEQAASHALAASYLGAMSAIAEQPDVQALAGRAASDEAQQATAVQLLASQIALSDSLTALDSARARAERRPGG